MREILINSRNLQYYEIIKAECITHSLANEISNLTLSYNNKMFINFNNSFVPDITAVI